MLIKDLQLEIEEELKSSHADYDIVNGSYGRAYRLVRPLATLEVTIDDTWIGYDLEISKDVLGRTIGFAQDTDNYPLSPKFEEGNLAVYDATIKCLRAFIADEVYAGYIDAKLALVMREDSSTFLLQLFKRFSSQTSIVSEQDVLSNPTMKRLSEYQA